MDSDVRDWDGRPREATESDDELEPTQLKDADDDDAGSFVPTQLKEDADDEDEAINSYIATQLKDDSDDEAPARPPPATVRCTDSVRTTARPPRSLLYRVRCRPRQRGACRFVTDRWLR